MIAIIHIDAGNKNTDIFYLMVKLVLGVYVPIIIYLSVLVISHTFAELPLYINIYIIKIYINPFFTGLVVFCK